MTDMPSEAELQAREDRVRANADRWADREALRDRLAAEMHNAVYTADTLGREFWQVAADAALDFMAAQAPSPASPEGRCCPRDTADGVVYDHCTRCHRNVSVAVDECPCEGPDEGLRELRRALIIAVREVLHKDWRVEARYPESVAMQIVGDAVLPLLTAEREQAEAQVDDLAARLTDMTLSRDEWWEAHRTQKRRADALQRQVDEALRLHRKTGGICNYDGLSWPCATAAALSRTATEGDDRD